MTWISITTTLKVKDQNLLSGGIPTADIRQN